MNEPTNKEPTVTVPVALVRSALGAWQGDAINAQHAQSANRCANAKDARMPCDCYSPKDDDGAFQALAKAAGIFSEF